jgi:hypothetical protein
MLCEGQPVITKEKQMEVERILLSKETYDAKIKKIVILCDYIYIREGSVIILKKKYTKAGDIPCISLEELRDSMIDIIKITEGICPPMNTREGLDVKATYIHDFIGSISQQELLLMEGEGMRVNQLTGKRKDIFENLLKTSYLIDMFYIGRQNMTEIDLLKNSYLSSKKENMDTIVGSLIPRRDKNGQLNFHSLRPREYKIPGTGNQINNKDKYINEKATLGDIENEINRLINILEIKDNLKGKSFSFSGLKYSGAEKISRTVARMFGLDFVKNKDRFVIRRKAIPMNVNISNWRDAIFAIIPDPLVRYLIKSDNQDNNKVYVGASNAMGLAKVCHDYLLNKHDSIIQKLKDKKIKFQELDNVSKSAVGMALALPFLRNVLQEIQQEVPFYISHLEDLLIRVRRVKDPVRGPKIALITRKPDGSGRWTNHIGWLNIPVPDRMKK